MAGELVIEYRGGMCTEGRKESAGLKIGIDAPGSGKGAGESFSPKDMLGLAYGSCLMMSMDKAAEKEGFDITGAKVKVSLEFVMRERPMVGQINATVLLPREYTDEEIEVLRKGENRCPVHNSMRSDIKKTVTFKKM